MMIRERTLILRLHLYGAGMPHDYGYHMDNKFDELPVAVPISTVFCSASDNRSGI
ncbi:MAG: DUF1850 domain-containing protein [Oscillospiraceae bacterium]|nr:DUF1850 domain-containing protein [Oscillospiraceae bacterium]